MQSNLAALIFPEKDAVHPCAGIEGILFLTLGAWDGETLDFPSRKLSFSVKCTSPLPVRFKDRWLVPFTEMSQLV